MSNDFPYDKVTAICMRKDIIMRKEFEKLMVPGTDDVRAYMRLREIVEILRKECPWDREQTHESLRSCMIEEAYEVAEAIDRGDFENLREELGDVMLQVIFHGILGDEAENFNIKDILNEESEKMIRRHPHIFCDDNIKTVDKVLEKWENIKDKEKADSDLTDRLKDIPSALPALVRAAKVQKKAGTVGFDFEKLSDALDKIVEETEELKMAFEMSRQSQIEDEIGDLLFSVVNVARLLKVEPESALEKTVNKFIARIEFMENSLAEQGMKLEDLSLEDMDLLWESAKIKDFL